MPFTVTMPKLSPTMEEGTIVKWHKAIGDQVEAGDLLIEVATDKATVEYNAIDSGWLRKIIIPEGQTAIVNQAIGIFTVEKNESIEGYKPTGATVQEAPKEEAHTSTTETKTEQASTAQKQPAKANGLQQPAFVPQPPLEHYQFEMPSQAAEKRIIASPLAKKLAKEKGLDLTTVKGSGPQQRIVSSDLERAQKSGVVTFGHREAPQIAPGTYEEEVQLPMRKVIAQRLQESKTFIPHFYVHQKVDVQPLIAIREQLSSLDVKLSINDFIIRACALALKLHPNVNSGFNSTNQTVIRFKTIDIAVAVSLPTGLITPILRHADYKNVAELSVEMRNLAKRAKAGKLELQEYQGGSFTLSNLGMYAISGFEAIINPPQAAILAVGGILDEPVIKQGAVVAGKTMNLSLSVDHRVIDGVAAAEFLKTVQKYIETPAGLLV